MLSEVLYQRIAGDLTVEELGDETLVYDERTHRAFCLNATSAAVWKLCDGNRTQAEIAAEASDLLSQPVPEEVVQFALQELQTSGLLKPSSGPERPLLTRRTLMERVGAGALLLLPAIAAITVPEPAQALSGIVTNEEVIRAERRRRAASSAGAQ